MYKTILEGYQIRKSHGTLDCNEKTSIIPKRVDLQKKSSV